MYKFYNQDRNEGIDQLSKHYGGSDRGVVREWIEGMGPYRFTSTLNFVRVIDVQEAWAHCGTFIRRMHKERHGKHWKKHYVKPYEGVVVLEMAPLNPKKPFKAITPHFHFLWRNHTSLPTADHDAIALLDNDLREVGDNLKDRKGRPLCRFSNGLNRFLPLSGAGMSFYLSKQAHCTDWRWSERVKLITGDGLA